MPCMRTFLTSLSRCEHEHDKNCHGALMNIARLSDDILFYDTINNHRLFLTALDLSQYQTCLRRILINRLAWSLYKCIKPSKPCHVGIHWMTIAEYSQMSTNVPWFQSFLKVFCIIFVMAKLATTSIRRLTGWHGVAIQMCCILKGLSPVLIIITFSAIVT